MLQRLQRLLVPLLSVLGLVGLLGEALAVSLAAAEAVPEGSVVVVDDLFSAREVRSLLDATVRGLEYVQGEVDFDGAKPAGAVADLDLNGDVVSRLVKRLEERAVGLFGDAAAATMAAETAGAANGDQVDDIGTAEQTPQPQLYRAYVNKFEGSDHPRAHRDAQVGQPDVTALVYANARWQRDWGGETVFYSDDHEIARAVRPRPGRVVFFYGALMHSARPPLPDTPDSRYSIALKWRRHHREVATEEEGAERETLE